MSGVTLLWAVMGGSLLLMLLAGIGFYWQVLCRRETFAALQNCEAQLKQQQTEVYQQEAQIRELKAGLRAEKAHVVQLQRKLEFAYANRYP